MFKNIVEYGIYALAACLCIWVLFLMKGCADKDIAFNKSCDDKKGVLIKPRGSSDLCIDSSVILEIR